MLLLNRFTLRDLANERLLDAKSLFEIGRYSSSYYLTGYVVELGLKACIAKDVKQYDFPDRDRTSKSWIHKLTDLAILARLLESSEYRGDAVLRGYWAEVCKWSPEYRYNPEYLIDSTEVQRKAAIILDAVNDSEHGVLRWLRIHW